MLTIRTWGPLALFANPHFRADPYSYDVMTPSAAKGLLRSIYWKPEFEWEVDEIHVLKPIRRDTFKVKSLKQASDIRDPEAQRTLQTVTCLVDVDYVVRARMVLNPLRARRPLVTYHSEALRRFGDGQQFRQPHFGRREYTANYQLLDARDELPSPIALTRDLGGMLFDLVPIDLGTAGDARHPDRLEPVFFRARLEAGVLRVPRALYDINRDRTMAVRNVAHHPSDENSDAA